MPVYLNKRCNFTSKPTRILWTCSICHEDFKSGVITYNPLNLEIIKKLLSKYYSKNRGLIHIRVSCCKVNLFFTEFYHKRNDKEYCIQKN